MNLFFKDRKSDIMNTNQKKKVVSIMLCVAMLAPMASMAMPVGAQEQDTFASSSVDTQKDKGEYSICEVDIIDGNGGYWKYNFDGSEIYVLENGEMAVGFVKINGNIYYFYEDEYEEKDEDGYEYGHTKGQMAVGWVEIDGEKYYFYEDETRKGQAAVGWVEIRDYGSWHYSKYYFNEDGRMAVGWVEIYGNLYYFDKNGQKTVGWIEIDGEKYYFNKYTLMAEGWTAIDGKIYYFYEDEDRKGQMAVGWVEIDDERYYFTENEGPDKGVMKTEWFRDDNDPGNRWYYAKTEEDVNGEGGNIGEVVTGEWRDDYGNEYYFVEEDGNDRREGELFTGWHFNGGEWYYYSEDTNNNEEHLGEMQIGLVKINGNLYYFYDDEDRKGQMARNMNIEIDDFTYHFNEEGVCTEIDVTEN